MKSQRRNWALLGSVKSRLLVQAVAGIQIALLVFPYGISQSSATATSTPNPIPTFCTGDDGVHIACGVPTGTPTNWGADADCGKAATACTDWNARMSNLKKYCGDDPNAVATPDPNFSAPPILMNGRQFSNYEECSRYVSGYDGRTSNTGGGLDNQQVYGSYNARGIDPYCSALSLYDTAIALDATSAALYYSAAVACFTALVADLGLPVTSQVVCAGLAVGAAGFDLGSAITITKTGQTAKDLLVGESSYGSDYRTFAGGGAAALSMSISIALARNTSYIKSVGVTGFGAVAAFLAIGTLKTVQLTGDGTSAHPGLVNGKVDACRGVNQMQALTQSTVVHGDGNKSTPGPTSIPPTRARANDTSAAGAGTSPQTIAYQTDKPIPPELTTPSSLAATVGSDPALAPLKNDIPKLVDPSKVNQIANALAKGTPPQQALASAFPDLPTEAKDLIKKIDDMKDDLKIDGLANPMGGRGGAPKSDSGGGFPSLGAKTANGANTTMSFESTKKTLELPTDGDIWHSNFNGSIFQLVTLKLKKDKDKIDELEWTLPMNRALLGLPKQLSTMPQQKKGK